MEIDQTGAWLTASARRVQAGIERTLRADNPEVASLDAFDGCGTLADVLGSCPQLLGVKLIPSWRAGHLQDRNLVNEALEIRMERFR